MLVRHRHATPRKMRSRCVDDYTDYKDCEHDIQGAGSIKTRIRGLGIGPNTYRTGDRAHEDESAVNT